MSAKSPAFARVFRLVAERGDWLELENVPGDVDDTHCYGSSIYKLQKARVRVFAKAGTRFSVTTAPVDFEWGNGTGVHLKPGVGIGESSAKGQVWARGDDFGVILPIAPKWIGKSYIAGDRFADVDVTKQPFLSVEAFKTQGVVFGENATVGPTRNSPGVWVSSPQLHHVEPLEKSKSLVEFGGPCMRIQALVDSTHLHEPGAGLAGGYSIGGRSSAPVILPGTELYWRDGTHAGIAVDVLKTDMVAPPAQGRTCGRLVTQSRKVSKSGEPYKTVPVNSFDLCFDAASRPPGP